MLLRQSLIRRQTSMLISCWPTGAGNWLMPSGTDYPGKKGSSMLLPYTILFAFGIILYYFLIAAQQAAANASGYLISLASFGVVGSVMGGFTGGNEAEWTHYLEKLVKAERDRFMDMLKSMEEGVAIIGADYKIRFMNPALIKDFGDGVGAYCFRHLIKSKEHCVEICKLPEVIKGNIERWELNAPHGQTYDVIASPFADTDQAPCIIVTFRNITKQKHIEQELVKLNQLKTKLLSEKTKELEDIANQIDKLKEEKLRLVRFLGIAAHDLQAPLAATQTCIWNILDGLTGPINDEQRALLEKSTKRINDLLALIRDLLDVPRIETGQLVREMTEVSLHDIVTASVEDLSILAKEKKIKINVESKEDLPPVYGSSVRLQEVARNLLSNAIKYSIDGPVTIRASCLNQELMVEVIDNGVGVDPGDLPHLFEDFFRGKNVIEKGTGLGLSICKRIIEAHGGKIWAESPNSETGKGTKFVFTIPEVIKQPAGNAIKGSTA